MATTVPGGCYRTANGKYVDANGRPIAPEVLEQLGVVEPEECYPLGGTAGEPVPTEPEQWFLDPTDPGDPTMATPGAEELGLPTPAEVKAAIDAAIDGAGRKAAEAMGLGKQDLTAIKGIGPARQRELNQLGIYSFAALAAADLDHLDTAMEVKREQIQAWKEEAAAKLAG